MMIGPQITPSILPHYDLKSSWDQWWRGLWEMEVKGDYNLDPFPARYFQALMGKPFFEAHADTYDQFVFDFFLAIDAENMELLEERLAAFSNGNPKNTLLVLKAGLMLAEDLNSSKMIKVLINRIGAQGVPFYPIDKSLEPQELRIVNPQPEAEIIETTDYSTLAKVAFIGLLILGGAMSGFFLMRRPSSLQLETAPYALQKDAAGTPLPSCEHPEYWPLHEQLIKQEILGCSVARELAQKVDTIGADQNIPNWRVQIVPKDAIPTKAAALMEKNIILISCENKQPVSSTLFELGNLQRSAPYFEIYQKAINGIIPDRDRYSYEIES
jgi:hypothetical protein